ncbi:TetR/AcrR family transcriptional regulator [Virgisporangium aurantiacum]|uniref:TetR family transcriptional regulator n=1 Tax=Virgisporangium aurantiacum TaxID=175570 RepID=A0A8J4E246_9ACTN|nr:TetR/AcrR family transcriptional regulator [Virgisporangium aurantiacum]GIJ56652.1 TetR family transcriptional regulator [Virgisporangium aurantiacum]
MAEAVGRRERKKAATRKAISDAATELFLERGFDDVSIREIADKADVSPTTVFAHFPQKEALVFDEDEEQRAELVAVVTGRPAGVSLAQAFHDHLRDDLTANLVGHADFDDRVRRFWDLINSTPALAEYGQRMWLRHEDAIAAAIAAEFGRLEPDDRIRVFARFVLQLSVLAGTADDRLRMLDAGFEILDRGWSTVEAQYTAR